MTLLGSVFIAICFVHDNHIVKDEFFVVPRKIRHFDFGAAEMMWCRETLEVGIYGSQESFGGSLRSLSPKLIRSETRILPNFSILISLSLAPHLVDPVTVGS